jgi:hypothetical protein
MLADAYLALYYVNNPNTYGKYLQDGSNSTILPIIYDFKFQNGTSYSTNNLEEIKHYSVENRKQSYVFLINYTIFGIYKVIAAILGYLIRFPRGDWKKDMLPFLAVIYLLLINYLV